MGDWEETYRRAMDMYTSRLWSKSRAMKAMESVYVGDRGVEVTAARPADVDDWAPNERPEPEDIEAARLLGVEPRPPARTLEASDVPMWWDEPRLRPEQVQAMTTLTRTLTEMQAAMKANGAPQPKYVLVHPDIAKDL